jgi:hypothetical protein
VGVEDGPPGANPSDRALAASRSAPGPQVMTTTSAPPAPAGDRAVANGRGSRAVSTSTVVGPDAAGDDREEPLERGRGVARQARQEVEHPLDWPGDDDTATRAIRVSAPV